jgi:hypothetical protein
MTTLFDASGPGCWVQLELDGTGDGGGGGFCAAGGFCVGVGRGRTVVLFGLGLGLVVVGAAAVGVTVDGPGSRLAAEVLGSPTTRTGSPPGRSAIQPTVPSPRTTANAAATAMADR